MDRLLQDLRFAYRRLLSRPGLTTAAVLTLALGIGANTAVFSLVRGVLLEPLPYAQPQDLVMIWKPGFDTDETWLSRREWVGYTQATRSFEHLAAYTVSPANLTEGSEPERVNAGFVSGNMFDALGVAALQGRPFSAAEDVAGKDDVVVLGYDLWQRRFGGAPDLVGKTIRVNGRVRTVVGIMPPEFRLPLDYREERPTELWVPLAVDQADPGDWGDRSYFLVARLRAGVTPATATADIRAAEEWERLGYIQDDDRGLDRDAIPLDRLLTASLKPALLILFGAVGFILLIACANVTNLLLARSDARRRDVATQAALGATRSRIARELMLESGLLAVTGAILGVALAYAGLQATLALSPVNLIRMRTIAVDSQVLGFSALLALVTTMLAGLAPALDLARVNLLSAMGAGGRGGAATVRKRLRHALVIAQTALSVVLVIGAGLLMRSFVEMRRIDLGFDPGNILTFGLALPQSDYPEPERVVAFYQQLLDRVEQLPGVENAAGVRILPLTRTIGDWSIAIEGRMTPPGSNPNGDWQVVTPGYFETVGVELARGRFFTDADNATGAPVVIINEHMARQYWPGEDALGKRFRLGTQERPWMTIVGITKPVRHNAVVEEPRTEMYVPHSQFPAQTNSAPRGMTVVIKTRGEPLALLPAARAQVRALDASLPVSDVRTFDQVAERALAQPRFLTILLGVFAALALTLAAIGMYSVIAFLVSRRVQEIGVRMALGATRGGVIRMVLGEGFSLAIAGVVIGVFGAAWLTRFLAAQLYGVQRLDPITFAIVPLVLVIVAGLAAFLPARKAAGISPLQALRG